MNAETILHASLERADATLHYASALVTLDDADRLVSVLTDLRHWATSHGVDFDAALRSSAMWCAAEQRDYRLEMAMRRTA